MLTVNDIKLTTLNTNTAKGWVITVFLFEDTGGLKTYFIKIINNQVLV
jgi:hypothetical protein